jgi:hypothetical protein
MNQRSSTGFGFSAKSAFALGQNKLDFFSQALSMAHLHSLALQ